VFAILSISPYYNKPTQKGLIKHYEAITKAVDAPAADGGYPGQTGEAIQGNVWDRPDSQPHKPTAEACPANHFDHEPR